MARNIAKAVPALKSWEDVDNALRDLGEARLSLSDLENQQNREIKEIQDKYKSVGAKLLARANRLETDIAIFVKANRAQLHGKSRRLTFGVVGYRGAPALRIPKGATQKVIDGCKAQGLLDCINVKETLLKDMLKRKGADVLQALGVSIKTQEKLYIDTPELPLADTGDT